MAKRNAPLQSVFKLTPEFELLLSQLYDELDDELKNLGATCNACGKCCHFKDFDHELWLTEPELAFLFSKNGIKTPVDDNTCPYLKDGNCTAREGRTLGCRIFHCMSNAEVLEDLFAKYLEKIRTLAKEVGFECGYGELMASLRSASGRIKSVDQPIN